MWGSSVLNKVSEWEWEWQENNNKFKTKLEELLNSLWEKSKSKQVEDLFKEIREKIGKIGKMEDNSNRTDKKNLKDLFDIIENKFLEIEKIVGEKMKLLNDWKKNTFL